MLEVTVRVSDKEIEMIEELHKLYEEIGIGRPWYSAEEEARATAQNAFEIYLRKELHDARETCEMARKMKEFESEERRVKDA